ncbi:hypothetical protein ACIOMM_31080 [Streptomyces sp. NPDC087908]|uniref:hypothetical protein n=1 Tax=Streptomyces sp. NPDC087908 TaxID=3365820 RepID=UPI00380FBB55
MTGTEDSPLHVIDVDHQPPSAYRRVTVIDTAQLELLAPIPGITEAAYMWVDEVEHERVGEPKPESLLAAFESSFGSGLNDMLLPIHPKPPIGLVLTTDKPETLTVRYAVSRGGSVEEFPPVEVLAGTVPATVDLSRLFDPWPDEDDPARYVIAVADSHKTLYMRF